MEWLALSILLLFCIVGFITLFFSSFGTFLIFFSAVIFGLLTELQIFGVGTLFVLLLLYLAGELMEYVFVTLGIKRFGASNWAVFGAIVGAVVGALLGMWVPGAGLFVGILCGLFLGGFFAEWLVKRDIVQSLRAGTGGVIGRLGAVLFKVFIALMMFGLMGYRLIVFGKF